MLDYNTKLKFNARSLRKNLTDSERLLWSYLKGKKLFNLQLYRQKPIGNYIVDFYAPKAKLVIEIDGSQHFEEENKKKDLTRDRFLANQGLKVLRFDNLQVLQSLNGVLEVILDSLKDLKSPLTPLFQRGEQNQKPGSQQGEQNQKKAHYK